MARAEWRPGDIPSIVDIHRETARRSLRGFVRMAWHVLEPETPLAWGPALDAMCEHLEAVTRGEIRRLLVNVPPGMMKSLLTSVFHPAWEWGPRGLPHRRFLATSHAETFTTRDCRKMRDLVDSDWYRERWGDEVRLVTRGATEFENTARGGRKGLPFSSLTGGRGDHLIIDDPHSTETAESQADRSTALRIFRESVPTRLNDPERSSIVVIMQRLHEEDIAGEILAMDYGYEHLCLPMRYEPGHPHPCKTSINFSDWRNEPGEPLFPERFPEESVAELETTLGSYAAAGQLQQRPAPRGGNIVKSEWFTRRFVDPTDRDQALRVSQTWDTNAKKGEANAHSACLTVAEFSDHVELWHSFSQNLGWAELLRSIRDQNAAWRPNVVLIEDKSSGEVAVQHFTDESDIPVKGVAPGRMEKTERLRVETAYIEAGHVWLPRDAPWVASWLEVVTMIPGGSRRDEGDALSLFLKWRRENPVKSRRRVAAPAGSRKATAGRPT